MKKTLLLFTFFTVFALSAQEDIFSYNYRNVPVEEMDAFIENEVVYWSGIHALLVKKKQTTGWAMLKRYGGRASDPNIYFYMGFGSYENLDNLNNNWQVAEAEYRSSMDPEKLALIDKQLNIPKRIAGEAIFNRLTSVNLDGGMENWNYLVHNYKNADNKLNWVQLQDKYFKPFFEKQIKAKNTKQIYWNAAVVLNPTGDAYDWNAYTADAYTNLSDVFNPWNKVIPWPTISDEDINDFSGNNFYKTVIWEKILWLDSSGNLKSRY
jgi:hypothetical protein